MIKYVDGAEVPLTDAEIADAEARAAEHAKAVALRRADIVREHRNALLAATDWRFRSDMTPSAEWVEYCQALRDVPLQDGFPESVVWPTPPSA